MCARKDKVYDIRVQMVMQLISQSECRIERTWPNVSDEVNKQLVREKHGDFTGVRDFTG